MSVRASRAVVTVVMGGLLLLAAPASAQQDACYPPPCAPGISDGTVEPGGEVTVTSGAGSYTAEEDVEYGVQSTYQRLGEEKADASGAAVVTFRMPSNLDVGRHHVVFTSMLTGKQVRVPFDLVAASSPRTGASSGVPDLLLEAVALIVAATLLATLTTRVLLGRRYRRHLAELTERLRHASMHDPLTGLPTRALLEDRIAMALQQRVHSIDRGVAVLRLDLNGVHSINEALGRDAGDTVLSAVAGRLVALARQGDTVARLDGDQFALMLADVDVEEAVTVADRLAREIGLTVDVDAARVTPAGSIGIVLSDGSQSATTLLEQADMSLSEAKRHPQGGHRVFGSEERAAVLAHRERVAEPVGSPTPGGSRWTMREA